MRSQIEDILDSSDQVGFQLTPKVFAIKTGISSLSPLGFVHVYRTDLGKIDCGLR